MQRTLVWLVIVTVLASAGCSSGSSDAGAGDPAPTAETTAAASSTTEPPPEPLEDQTPPSSINGLAVQGDTIWVASIKDDEIVQVDRESGAILQRFDTVGAGPDDVAVAPDGTVWSTGFANGDVGRIADGEYDVVTTIDSGINPLEFGPDGNLYIGTYGPDGKLFRLDPDEPATATELAEGLDDINAFGILDDGTIIAPAGGIAGPGSAIAIAVNESCLADTGCTRITRVVSDLPGVAAGATDTDGNPYLLANATGEVIAVDVEDGTSEVVRTVEQGAPFDNLSFADDEMLYLSSFIAPTITEVAPDGTERLITIGG